MRGRHFAFIGLFFAAWVSARIGFLGLESQGDGMPTSAPAAGTSKALGVTQLKQVVAIFSIDTESHRHLEVPKTLAGAPVHPEVQPTASEAVVNVAAPSSTLFQAPALSPPLPPATFESQLTGQTQARRRLEIYAYSFVRQGSQTLVPLGSGRYGGSQSAIIAALPLLHFPAHAAVPRLSAVGRAAIAHENRKERELAAGLRWQPVRQIPLHLTAERRFLEGRADAFALYAAGGKSGIALPLDFKLDGYAHAGFMSGKRAGAFADFSARADRQITSSGAAAIAGGVGIWGGGQSGIMRIDIGPTLRTDITAAGAQFRLAADWRFRVAGSAQPGNGPALTLSTSF